MHGMRRFAVEGACERVPSTLEPSPTLPRCYRVHRKGEPIAQVSRCGGQVSCESWLSRVHIQILFVMIVDVARPFDKAIDNVIM